MPVIPLITMNDGVEIPQIGLGLRLIAVDELPSVLAKAVEVGYRLVDTAQTYGNEEGVGQAIAQAAVDRGDLFITTKIANANQGRTRTLESFDKSMAALHIDVLDLCLIHWPQPMYDQYVDTWQALIDLRDEGRVRSIGVSNFTETCLERLIAATNVAPAVNQVELHPQLPQDELQAYHREHGILTEAWAPLGQGGTLLAHPVLLKLAAEHGQTPAQVVIRWHVQRGNIVVPKTSKGLRMIENIGVDNFRLSAEDMAVLATLPEERLGPDPELMAVR
jgi:diketogulonate reductase-like aldo/keto reductase